MKNEVKSEINNTFDLNILKKPKYFVPLLLGFIIFFSIISILIWKPGIAKGEYSLQDVMLMLSGQEKRISQLEDSKPSKVSNPSPVASTDTSPAPTSPAATTNTVPKNYNQTVTNPVSIVPTPVPTNISPIPACDQSKLTYYENKYSLDPEAENNRYGREVGRIRAYYASFGAADSSGCEAAVLEQVQIHESNLARLANEYQYNRTSTHCV